MQLTAVRVEGPYEGRYFAGVPIRVTAIPAPGFVFDGWGPDLPESPELRLTPDADTTLRATFR